MVAVVEKRSRIPEKRAIASLRLPLSKHSDLIYFSKMIELNQKQILLHNYYKSIILS